MHRAKSSASLNSKELLQLYQSGQNEAATVIFDRYVARLIALARSRIGPKLKRRIDAEDVVQSAYCSFFLHANIEGYELGKSGDLWRLLASITHNKLYRQIERQTAAKRSVDREQNAELLTAKLETPEPSPAEVVAVVEELQRAAKALTPEEQFILTSMFAGQAVEDISKSIRKSDRTTRRHLAEVKRKFEQRLLASDAPFAATRHNTAEPEAPLVYSDYLLERMLAAGGMGKVFRARERQSGNPMAIKALHKSRQSEDRAVARFVQEAQILAEVRHPNIVGVRGLGRFPSGGYFIVMDFVDGVDLQTRLQQGPFPLNEAVRIVTAVATAVEHAHVREVVHCDLKPANVLLDKSGRVFVSDFGFAFLVAGSSAVQSIGGTAGYVAPEILLRRSVPTPAADIYALGMLIWTLATGRMLTHHDLEQALNEPLAEIYSICRLCTANEPSNRYRSVQALLERLDGLGRLVELSNS